MSRQRQNIDKKEKIKHNTSLKFYLRMASVYFRNTFNIVTRF
jgi:hypothetical protein